MFTKTLQGSKLKKNMYGGHFWAMVYFVNENFS